jgi:biotin carboxylase
VSRGPLLVLAGGVYQLPLIHAARSRGLEVVLFDGDPDAPGFEHAQHGEVVDIADPDRVISAARRWNPAGVASIVSDVAVRSGAVAAAALGLPGIDVETAEVCTDKFLMRSRCERAGMRCPPFAAVTSVEDARDAAVEVGFPLVVKPVDSSGSRGVTRVDMPAGVAPAVELALASSRQGRALLEGFLEGIECTVETFSVDGRTEVLGVSDKRRLPFPHCVSISLTYPPSLDASVRNAVVDVARRGLEAAGVRNGPGHVEVMVTLSGPVILELAARGGGYRIFSDILPRISGVDPVAAVIDQALGLTPRIMPAPTRAAVLRFFNPAASGMLTRVSGVDEAVRDEHVLDVVIEAAVGKPFQGITRDGERPGYVITLADTPEEAVAAADRAEQQVVFHIQPEHREAHHETPPASVLSGERT